MTPSTVGQQTRLIYGIFFVQAFAGGGIFARIPDIQAQTGLNDAALGVALTAASVGGLVSLLVAARLVHRFGTRAAMIWCLPLISLSHLGAALTSDLVSLALALFGAGVMFSISNVAMNVEADRIEAASGHLVMNRCHGMWSLGMLAASLAGVAARAVPISPLLHFAIVLLPVAAFAIWAWAHMSAAPPRGTIAIRKSFAMPDRTTLVLLSFGISATVAQIGVQNWSVIYMADRFSSAPWIDTLTLPAFLALMALGRLYADAWVARIGAQSLARALAVLSFIGGVLVVFAPSLWLVILGFALTGLGTAALFPMMISAAARVTHRPSEDSVSAVIFLLGVVALLVPAAMGWVAEAINLRVAFAGALPLFLLTFALARVAGTRPTQP